MKRVLVFLTFGLAMVAALKTFKVDEPKVKQEIAVQKKKVTLIETPNKVAIPMAGKSSEVEEQKKLLHEVKLINKELADLRLKRLELSKQVDSLKDLSEEDTFSRDIFLEIGEIDKEKIVVTNKLINKFNEIIKK